MLRLPIELHDEILSHLNRTEIASYRLTSRRGAIAGAPHLFKRLHFRSSLESLQCLANISKCDCGRHVNQLMWNTLDSEFETQAFLEGLRTRELKYVLGRPIARSATKTIEEVAGEQIEEEGSTTNLGVFLLGTIFSGFPSLTSIYIMTTASSPSALAEDSWGQRSKENSEIDPWPEVWKLGYGYHRWRGPRHTVVSNGRYELQVAALAAHSIGQPLRRLSVENLSLRRAKSSLVLPGYERALKHLTHLELVLDGPDKALDEAKRLFHAVGNIRVLKLWLHSNSAWEYTDFSIPALRLQNIFPDTESFPHLQELELHQFEVGQEFLTNFLFAHTRTLKVLRMHCMRLTPWGLWMALFASIRGKLDTLETIGLYGEFEQADGVGWNIDSAVGLKLSAYLLEREEGRAKEVWAICEPGYINFQ